MENFFYSSTKKSRFWDIMFLPIWLCFFLYDYVSSILLFPLFVFKKSWFISILMQYVYKNAILYTYYKDKYIFYPQAFSKSVNKALFI